MVITVWLHMLRVFMTGSYKKPREFNWSVGVLLLTLTLLLSFTGYLLPDDQLGFWAVTVGTNMARATPLVGHEGPFGPELGLGRLETVTTAAHKEVALFSYTTSPNRYFACSSQLNPCPTRKSFALGQYFPSGNFILCSATGTDDARFYQPAKLERFFSIRPAGNWGRSAGKTCR